MVKEWCSCCCKFFLSKLPMSEHARLEMIDSQYLPSRYLFSRNRQPGSIFRALKYTGGIFDVCAKIHSYVKYPFNWNLWNSILEFFYSFYNIFYNIIFFNNNYIRYFCIKTTEPVMFYNFFLFKILILFKFTVSLKTASRTASSLDSLINIVMSGCDAVIPVL